MPRRLMELGLSRRRIVESQEALRRQIAEMLHNRVQNVLLMAAYYMQQAHDSIEKDPTKAKGLITKARSLVEEVNRNEIRNIAKQLHPSIVKLGLVPALRSLINDTEVAPVRELAISGEIAALEGQGTSRLEEGMKLAIYRVAEEALNNVRKHSQAPKVEIRLDMCRKSYIRLAIKDEGCGFEVAHCKPGLGILIMNDYTGAFGGDITLESNPGRGTQVVASFPLRFQKRPQTIGL